VSVIKEPRIPSLFWFAIGLIIGFFVGMFFLYAVVRV